MSEVGDKIDIVTNDEPGTITARNQDGTVQVLFIKGITSKEFTAEAVIVYRIKESSCPTTGQ